MKYWVEPDLWLPRRQWTDRETYLRRKAFRDWMRNHPTLAEAEAWKLFQQLNRQNRPNHIFYHQCSPTNSKFVLDFYCPTLKVGIEIDGSSHIGREEKDAIKDRYFARWGIRVLRYPNSLVLDEPRRFLELLKKEIER